MGRAGGTRDAFGRPVTAPEADTAVVGAGGTGPVARPPHRVRGVLLLAFFAGLTVLALWPSPSGRDPVPHAVDDALKAARKLPPGSGVLPLGMWEANGIVLKSKGFSEGTRPLAGRKWMIYQRCSTSCTRWIARTTSLGIQRTPLEQRGGRWMAVFNSRTDGCGTKEIGRDRAAFVFSVAADQRTARAVEINSASFPGCHGVVATGLPVVGKLLGGLRSDQRASSKVVWTASRYASNCEWMPTCREAANHAPTYTADETAAVGRATEACVRSGVARTQCACATAGALNWITPAQVQAAAEAIADKRLAAPSSAAAINRALQACEAAGGS